MEWGVHLLRPLRRAEADALKRAGIARVAVHLPWRWAGTSARDWSAVEHFVEPLREAGLPVLGLLGPGMPHLLPDSVLGAGPDADYPDRFAAYCAAAAARFPWIDAFRVEDELNAAGGYERFVTRRRLGRAWSDPGFRLRLLRLAVDAVRGARPDAELRATLHAGMPGWRAELRRWLAGGVRLDRVGLTLVPCFVLPDPQMAERVGEALAEAREVLAAGPWADGAPALEVSRIGYPTHRALFSPRRQREFLLIAARQAKQEGAAGLCWWSLRDQAYPDPILRYWPPAQERHFGLWHYGGRPKAAWEELRALATGDRFGEGGP